LVPKLATQSAATELVELVCSASQENGLKEQAHATLRAAVESADAGCEDLHSDHEGLAKALDAALKPPGPG